MKIFSKLIVLCLLIAGGFYYWQSSKQQPTTMSYLSETVKRADVEETVSAVGSLSPAQLVSVGAQVTGQIKNFHVTLGQSVKKGDLIAEINAQQQQNTLASVQSQLASQMAQLDSKTFVLETAKKTYEREKALWKRDATSKRELNSAKADLLSAEAGIKALQAEIKQSQIRLDTEKTNLGYTRITAPIDGTIVSSSVEAGQTLNASQSSPTLVQIADLSTMLIKMQIAEADAVRVKAGMPVVLNTLGNNEEKIRTTLLSVDPGLTHLSRGSYNNNSDVSDNAIYYYGRAKVSNADGRLRVGMTVLGNIIIRQAKDVLTVPSQAVKHNDAGAFVRVLTQENGIEIVTDKPVSVGLSDGTKTEITQGLTEGERVVITAMSAEEMQQSANAQAAGGL